MKQRMKRVGVKKKKWIGMICILLVLIGVLGGIGIKKIFFEPKTDGMMMSNQEAIRLISYLGLAEYEYPDRLGSSFSYGETRKLFDAAGVSYDKSPVSISLVPGFMPLTKSQFENVYGVLVQELDLDRLSAVDLYIYNIDNENDREIDGILYEIVNTNAGDFFLEKKYALDRDYIGKIVKVYVSNNEMILCSGESEESVAIQNAYIVGDSESEDEGLICYVNGTMKNFAYANKDVRSDKENYLGDIMFSNKGITQLVDHTADLVQTKVTAYDDGVMMVEGYEEPLYLSTSFSVYKTNGKFKAMKSAGTLIGYDEVSLYVLDGVVEAALVEQEIYEKDIRVLIQTTDYAGYYHNGVMITSDTPFTVTSGSETKEYEAKEQLEFQSGSKEFAGGNIKITSKEEDGKIKITTIQRQSGTPAYRGTIELVKNDKGLLVINELPIEQYLYGVVPSEMPVTYETEALKAQAICARAYAYRQMDSDKFAQYGAHLDDSISSQVYNNVEEDERAIYAVDDTYGVVPCYNDEVIESFFFSTSCGSTSNNSEVWGGNPEAYLLDTMETEFQDIAELQNEESFHDFIDGKLGKDYIEEAEPFFRWEVVFDKKQLGDVINSHLYDRIQAMPEYILAENAKGDFEKKSINSIGDLVDIQVTKRGSSGIILEMVITGTAETILVKGQANARALLNPESVSIRKQDGTSITGWTSLPSAYFYVNNGENEITIKGGGFGHGVGMSQNGANDMAKMGYTACDIIEHYYTAVELKDMYSLMGR
ncbi:MAG: SpoIID/LytB domain-containing protein [Eubacteriales bacterium]|nr:SpoIID/LytB domain-containing protein [Eubacteriales bacterium]